LLSITLLLLAPSVSAQQLGNDTRVELEFDLHDPGIRSFEVGPDLKSKSNPCFPHACGDRISGPKINPDPREPEDKPACYYGAEGVLFYERAGSRCDYKKDFTSYKSRVEMRRLEWLSRDSSGH